MLKKFLTWIKSLFQPKVISDHPLRMLGGGARSTKVAPLTELVWRAIMNKDPSIILPDCPKDQYANVTILINSELADKNTLHKVIMKLLK